MRELTRMRIFVGVDDELLDDFKDLGEIVAGRTSVECR